VRTFLNEGGLDLNPDPSNAANDPLDGSIVVRGRAAAVDAVFKRFRPGQATGLSAEILAALTRKPRRT
jgi:ribosomal protein L35AE/L33A